MQECLNVYFQQVTFAIFVSLLPCPVLSRKNSDTASSASSASNEWSYEASEEDWGQTCFVSTRVGDVKVGFMASPGKDLIGYVDGLFQGDVSATWKVDDKISRVSEVGVNDYFGWHEFGDLGGEMLTAMTTCQQLTISTPAGKSIAVGLRGASAAITSFQHCVGKGG